MKEYLESHNLFIHKEIEDFLLETEIRKLKKHEFFIEQDEICDNLSIVVSGVFRSFYYSRSVEEITYCFTFPNGLLMAYSSFISGKRSQENIQAISEAEIISIPKKFLDQLASSNPNCMELLRRIAEREYVELEKWIFNHQKNNAKERYLELIERQPQYVQQVPLQFIASYYGQRDFTSL